MKITLDIIFTVIIGYLIIIHVRNTPLVRNLPTHLLPDLEL